MSMFTNFVNTQGYIPNNIVDRPTNNCKCCSYNSPCAMYDDNGDFIGYSWYYGNTIKFVFETTGSVEAGNNYITNNQYFQNKTMQVKIFNWKFEEIYQENFDAVDNLEFYINKDLSNSMTRGIYYLSLTLIDNTTLDTITLVDTSECHIDVL